MASSTVLSLVNKVLSLSGDLQPNLVAITGSTGGIAERIVEMINLTIGDVERAHNWPVLRVNSQGTADGLTGIFDFTGVEDARVGGAVSVWVSGVGPMKEVTPEQFDTIVAEQSITGEPAVFQRGVSAAGKLSVQLYPTPTAGQLVNVSAYHRATRLTQTTTDTTEFDDDILILGALNHLDAYDGLDRGYGAKFKQTLSDYISEAARNQQFQVATEDYR